MIVVVKSGETRRLRFPSLVVAACLIVACSASSGQGALFSDQTPTPVGAPSARPGVTFLDAGAGPTFQPASRADLGAPCDPTRSIRNDGPALLVKEPEVLARFSLERTLSQIIATAGVTM